MEEIPSEPTRAFWFYQLKLEEINNSLKEGPILLEGPTKYAYLPPFLFAKRLNVCKEIFQILLQAGASESQSGKEYQFSLFCTEVQSDEHDYTHYRNYTVRGELNFQVALIFDPTIDSIRYVKIDDETFKRVDRYTE